MSDTIMKKPQRKQKNEVWTARREYNGLTSWTSEAPPRFTQKDADRLRSVANQIGLNFRTESARSDVDFLNSVADRISTELGRTEPAPPTENE